MPGMPRQAVNCNLCAHFRFFFFFCNNLAIQPKMSLNLDPPVSASGRIFFSPSLHPSLSFYFFVLKIEALGCSTYSCMLCHSAVPLDRHSVVIKDWRWERFEWVTSVWALHCTWSRKKTRSMPPSSWSFCKQFCRRKLVQRMLLHLSFAHCSLTFSWRSLLLG